MLGPATTILDNSIPPLAPGSYAIPCVADWNGDGRKDLIVGYRYADKIAVYLNSGTDAEPAFTSFVNLQAGGADIYQAGSGCGAPAPWVCDYDGDGKRDVLVGNGSDGTVWLYRNTNTDAEPMLAAGVQLALTNGLALSVGYRATPYVTDWDEDGLPDLLCGNGDGYVYFFKNVGTRQAPAFGPPALIQASGTALNLGYRSVVRVFDWDGDGLKDLLGSSATGVYWCRNTNNNTAVVLQAPVALYAPVSGIGHLPIATGPRMRLDLADWNDDGVMDVILGNADGTVFLYEGYHFAFTEATRQPDGQVKLTWRSAPFLTYRLWGGECVTNLQSVIATNLSSAGCATVWTNRVGNSQQFFRVQVEN